MTTVTTMNFLLCEVNASNIQRVSILINYARLIQHRREANTVDQKQFRVSIT